MRKTKKRKRNKAGEVILSLVFLFLLGILLLGALIFASAKTYESKSLTVWDLFQQAKVVKRLSQLLWESEAGKVCKLTLSQAEVSAIIAAIANSDSAGDFLLKGFQVNAPTKQRSYKVIFKDDYFVIKFSIPVSFREFFASNINFTLAGKPQLDENGINFRIKSIAAGKLPLPVGPVQKLLNSLLRKSENEKVFKRIHEVVVKAYIDKANNLVIYFYPYRIRNCLTEGF